MLVVEKVVYVAVFIIILMSSLYYFKRNDKKIEHLIFCVLYNKLLKLVK